MCSWQILHCHHTLITFLPDESYRNVVVTKIFLPDESYQSVVVTKIFFLPDESYQNVVVTKILPTAVIVQEQELKPIMW